MPEFLLYIYSTLDMAVRKNDVSWIHHVIIMRYWLPVVAKDA